MLQPHLHIIPPSIPVLTPPERLDSTHIFVLERLNSNLPSATLEKGSRDIKTYHDGP
jgi:hypothetical protein